MTTLHEKIAMQIIEHAHLGVKNSAKTEAFLIAAPCEFSLRGSGNAAVMRRQVAIEDMWKGRITLLP